MVLKNFHSSRIFRLLAFEKSGPVALIMLAYRIGVTLQKLSEHDLCRNLQITIWKFNPPNYNRKINSLTSWKQAVGGGVIATIYCGPQHMVVIVEVELVGGGWLILLVIQNQTEGIFFM